MFSHVMPHGLDGGESRISKRVDSNRQSLKTVNIIYDSIEDKFNFSFKTLQVPICTKKKFKVNKNINVKKNNLHSTTIYTQHIL